MNWKAKAHALALLSRVPGGRGLYHRLQRIAGTNRLNIRRELDRAFEITDMTVQAGGALNGASFLEIGTGWRPVLPFLLALAGARRVITLDVNPWLTAGYAKQTWNALPPYLDEIADRCAAPRAAVHARFQRVSSSARRLEQFLEPLDVEYRCPADAGRTGLRENSLDVVASSNVLEHLPAATLSSVLGETLRVLKPGGLAVHRFNPQDHFSTFDSGITHGNFLQFSSREWHWYGGSGLAFHNRMRCRDYKLMFEGAGFETVVGRERIDQPTLQAITSGQLTVHEEFSNYTPHELAVDYVWMVCRKPLGRERGSPLATELRAESHAPCRY